MARWLCGGNLEFLGRIDNQVKIRGFRIETTEIETQLLKYKPVKEAVVVVQDHKPGDKYLCAYIVPNPSDSIDSFPSTSIDILALRDYLCKRLPDYMVPTHFVPLEKIPLTPNGKVNRRALPKVKIIGDEKHKTPRNPLEKKLSKIWAEVLFGKDDNSFFHKIEARDKSSIGIDDNFFELGGHSLKATIMVSKIHKEFNTKLPLTEVFRSPTIRQLAGYIKSTVKGKYISVEPEEKRNYYALSSAQKRLYVLQQMDESSTGYNIPAVIVLEGTVDKDKLQSVFRKLINMHESLRTSFDMVEEKPVQRVHHDPHFEIEYYDLQVTDQDDRYKCQEALFEQINTCSTGEGEPAHHIPQLVKTLIGSFIRPFDLSQAPLLRVGMIKLLHTPAAFCGPSQERKGDKHLLMVDMHHIIAGGDSIDIFLHDFTILYQGEELPPAKLQYKDFSQWQNRLFLSEEIKNQEKYWLNRFSGEIPVLNLPTDYPKPQIKKYEGESIYLGLNQPLTRQIEQLAMKTKTTMFILLLAIFQILLFKYTAEEDIIVGTPVAGKTHADLQNIIGMFVNMLALRNQPKPNKIFRKFLMEVKENTLEAFENQDYQFDELVWKLNARSDMNQNPLVDIVFDYKVRETSPEVHSSTALPNLSFKSIRFEHNIAKFDLLLNVYEYLNGLNLKFTYRTQLFKRETIEKMSCHFQNVIETITENPDVKISEIGMLNNSEKEGMLKEIKKSDELLPMKNGEMEQQMSKNLAVEFDF